MSETHTEELDFSVSGGGSVFIVTPMNRRALQHLQQNVSSEALWYAGGLAVEARYIDPLAEGLRAHGFTVE